MKKNRSFRKVKRLGKGAFAETWLAEVLDPELAREWGTREVALKIPLDDEKERILKNNDIRLGMVLSFDLADEERRNIVSYYGFEVFEDRMVMVMEYIAGQSLRDRIGYLNKRRRLGVDESIQIARGVLNGLKTIHTHRMIHRDIKPENILMQGDVPKIADLGVGRMLRTNEVAETQVGTLYYMSPELIMLSEARHNTDIWSLGVMFYEMIYARFPFNMRGRMPQGLIVKQIMDNTVELVFPDDVEVPEPVKAVIARSLDRDPSARYQTAAEMIADLDRIACGESPAEKQDEVAGKIASIQEYLFDPARVSEAEKELKALAKQHPGEIRIVRSLGDLYNRIGDYHEAVTVFEGGIRSIGGDAMCYWGLATAHNQLKNYGPAAEAFQKAVDLGIPPKLRRTAERMRDLCRQQADG